ncbi:hypothetical protein BGZ72_009736 [Mortierella alpina]|nr:hypothetical protein BGZ68_004165 [Mortierella alpina]KAF9568818.1 hypothetical protein EC968_002839 [Mortierella alpina]KAF9937054.1 hypothetical protein BGZ67_001719 [Mortierella alpina]KAF9948321.1 hypothetical protein BGZ72_009736 [Mortierella alpina]KAF9985751.1 hypothetical protein BGZ75_002587 [Mortierella antarctica]
MAGGRYPYPKHVWSPTGGWWTQPTNWKANTAVAVGISATIVAAAWKFSAQNEERHMRPKGWIPSQMWAKEFQDGEVYGKK